MTTCVIDGKQCECQPDDGIACQQGTPAEVQAALNAEITRLRAAYEYAESHAARLMAERDEARAALAQAGAREPLFYVRLIDGGRYYEGPVHAKSVGGKAPYPPKEWTPLYAHPSPAQEPLSKAQIDGAAFGRGTEAGDTYAAIHEFARAIEHACAATWGVKLADSGTTSGTKGAAS